MTIKAEEGDTTASTTLKLRLQEVVEATENNRCCDCGDVKPTWASILVPPPGVKNPKQQQRPMGAFCCFHCSGAHRRLGVHICFVRSISLDEWKESEVEAMEAGGNDRVNDAFEAKLNSNVVMEKPNPQSDLEVRNRFIQAKYREREFFDATRYHTKEKRKKFDPSIVFLGMSRENLFSASKADLYEAFSASKVFTGMSKESLVSASKADFYQILMQSKSVLLPPPAMNDGEIMSEEHSKKPPSSRKNVDLLLDHRPEDDTDECIQDLKDSPPQETSSSEPTKPSSSSTRKSHSASSSRSTSSRKGASSSSSKSPIREGRSSSRPRQQQRSRRSHHGSDHPSEQSSTATSSSISRSSTRPSNDPSSSESKSSTTAPGGSSSRRTSSRSRRSHVKESSTSSSNRMRRSSSGPTLDSKADAVDSSSSSQPKMRRSGSGVGLVERASSRPRNRVMRRSGSGPSLSNEGSSQSQMRRSGSGATLGGGKTSQSMRRNTSGNYLHDLPPPRPSGRQHSVGATANGNEEFHVLSPPLPTGGSLTHSLTTRVVASKYALEEFSTTLTGGSSPPQKTTKRGRKINDPLSVGSSHGTSRSRGQSHRSTKSKSPRRPLSGRRLHSQERASEDVDLPTERDLDSLISGRRSLASGDISEDLETPESKGKDRSHIISSRRSLTRRNSFHDLRRPPSWQNSGSDASTDEKSVNPTIPLALPRHLKKKSSLDSRSEHTQLNLARPLSRLSLSKTEGNSDNHQAQQDEGKEETTAVLGEKLGPSTVIPTHTGTPRRRPDPLSSRSEHVSSSRSTMHGRASLNVPAALPSRNLPEPISRRRGSLTFSSDKNSLGSASTHGKLNRKRVSGGQSDQVFQLFATSASSAVKTGEDYETEGTISCSSDGSVLVATEALSAEARRALEALKELSK